MNETNTYGTMNTKHTPGPWDIWTDREENEIYGKVIGINIVAENHRTSVGTVHGMRSNDEAVRETAAANARLIAAAPELLEIARAVAVSSAKFTPEFREQIRATIAKATGETI